MPAKAVASLARGEGYRGERPRTRSSVRIPCAHAERNAVGKHGGESDADTKPKPQADPKHAGGPKGGGKGK